MTNRIRRYAAILAISSLLPLALSSAEALAKSSQSRSRSATPTRTDVYSARASAALNGGATMSVVPRGRNYPPYPGGLGPHDNTAGWGNVGAF